MTDSVEYQSIDVLLPNAAAGVIVKDPSAGVRIDMQNDFGAGRSAIDKFVSIQADGDDVYLLAGPDATVVADPAAVPPSANQCLAVFNRCTVPFRVHADTRYVYFKSASPCKVRIAIASYGQTFDTT